MLPNPGLPASLRLPLHVRFHDEAALLLDDLRQVFKRRSVPVGQLLLPRRAASLCSSADQAWRRLRPADEVAGPRGPRQGC
jgi:hypothetical protein